MCEPRTVTATVTWSDPNMPLGNREGGGARKSEWIFHRVVCFRLKRYDILKIPSEQPLGCSAFFFSGAASLEVRFARFPMNIFRRAWLCKKRSSEPAQRPAHLSGRTHGGTSVVKTGIGMFYAVGVGPGDPAWMTRQACDVLGFCPSLPRRDPLPGKCRRWR